jgi:hypothetical protein
MINNTKFTFLAKSFVVTNLLRFINEFWFINLKSENLEEIVKSDQNLTNNVSTLISKLKIYDSFETFISKLNQARKIN